MQLNLEKIKHVKRKTSITLLIILISMTLGLFLGYKVFVAPKSQPTPWIVPNTNNISNKFISKEALVTGIHSKDDLITTEVDISEKVVLDNSWGDLSIFKKVQNVTFSAKGMYSVDLSNLNGDNIAVNNDNKSITITLPQPIVKSINIDEDKTVYETPDNGILRFGEIKLTTAEHDIMMKNVKEKMSEKMKDGEFYSTATKNSQSSISALVQAIVTKQSNVKYGITINFK